MWKMVKLFINKKVTDVWEASLLCTEKHAILFGGRDYYCHFNLIPPSWIRSAAVDYSP